MTNHIEDGGRSVLEELTATQIGLLRFLAGEIDLPPRRATPQSRQALARRGLVRQVPEDRDRWHATDAGREVVAALALSPVQGLPFSPAVTGPVIESEVV